ncbi:MAG: hypothetical protein ACT4QF_22550 [Sporichthyaceae bacterium]
MSTPRSAHCPPLPPGARLLHAGIPKSGTTSLQRTAAANRSELLAAGVRYPGSTWNHRAQVAALLARDRGGHGPVDRSRWDRLAEEVRGDPSNRVLVSHEFAAEADDAQAARFAEELGPDLHVVLTLRGFAHLLGPGWQQGVKWGLRQPFDDWLRDLLADPPAPGVPAGSLRRYDHAGLVHRWIRTVGRERVWVVVTDKARPQFIGEVFADLLGVPRDLLSAPHGPAGLVNRSLSWSETELIRAVNRAVRGPGRLETEDRRRLVTDGAVRRLLQARSPGPDDEPTRLPSWAAAIANERAARMTAEILASGVRVLGEVDLLTAAPPTRAQATAPTHVPLEVAVHAVVGTAAAAAGHGALFDKRAPAAAEPTPTPRLEDASGRDLLAALATRATRRAAETARRRVPSPAAWWR